jgi:hypothetical protein
MKRMMSIAAIALFMAGSSAFACGGCGCSAKKAEAKTGCTACSKDKKSETKCGADCKKACCAKKADATKATAK